MAGGVSQGGGSGRDAGPPGRLLPGRVLPAAPAPAGALPLPQRAGGRSLREGAPPALGACLLPLQSELGADVGERAALWSPPPRGHGFPFPVPLMLSDRAPLGVPWCQGSRRGGRAR